MPSSSWRDGDITPFERCRVLNPPPSATAVSRIQQRLVRRLPGMKGVAVREAWAGMIDSTPDLVPVMDQMPDLQGLYLASGFSGHGFGIGPAAGRIMADMMQNNEEIHNLERFRFSRFSDGSALVLGPSL